MSNPDPNNSQEQGAAGWGPPSETPGQAAPGQGAPPPGHEPNGWGAPAQPGQYGQPPAGQWGQPPQQYGQPPAGSWGQPPQQYGQPPAGQWGPQQWGQQPGDRPDHWGQPPGQWGQPQGGQYGQYGSGGPVPPGWGPVPRPGIVPLRPLTLGEIYDGAIRSIRTNPAVMFVFSAILVAISVAIQGVLTWSTFEDLNAFMGMDPEAMQDVSTDSLFATMQGLLVNTGISALAAFLITTILNGLLIHAVSQAVLGRSATLAQVWDAVKGQIPRLLLLSIVVAVMMAALVAVFVGLFAAGAVSESPGLMGLSALGFIFILLPALLVLATFTLLATPALVLERAGVGTALRRSFQLTKRSFWRVLGIYLLTSILVAILAWVISSPSSLFAPLLGSPAAIYVVTLVASVIASAITTPFMAAVVALLYIDVRMRTEALDVELAKAAGQG